MRKQRKALALVMCAFALVAASIFGTIAYLTDTDAVTNTFTVGHVDIILDEAKVDEKGVAGADRVTENKYHLVPGHSYVKDPTVTVIGGSDEAYVRMIVAVENLEGLKNAIPEYVAEDGVFLIQNLCEGWNPAVWVFEGFDDTTDTYEFRYHKTVGTWGGVDTEGNKTKDTKLEALFTSIKLPGELINNAEMDMIKGVEIKVVAHAIQADGFVDADGNPDVDAAWTAFDAQKKTDEDGKEIGNPEYETTAAESETTDASDDGDIIGD